jgi:hypothetical protein
MKEVILVPLINAGHVHVLLELGLGQTKVEARQKTFERGGSVAKTNTAAHKSRGSKPGGKSKRREQ